MGTEVDIRIIAVSRGVRACASFRTSLKWMSIDPRHDVSGFKFGIPLDIDVHTDDWSYRWVAPWRAPPHTLWRRILWAIQTWWRETPDDDWIWGDDDLPNKSPEEWAEIMSNVSKKLKADEGKKGVK